MRTSELILVVDDTPANLEVISETLADAGFDVATALDGERALKRIQHHLPDLILLDVMMPGIDGFETCRRLKRNCITADIPIIFMTALSETEHKIKGFNLGAVDYITKPFQEAEVVMRVKTHLQLRRLTKELEHRVEERTRELATALDQLQQSQLQLVQREKMSALGNLVAGVAHEINNPIGFLGGNLQPAQEYIKDLLGLLDLYQQEFPNPGAPIENTIEAINLPYLQEDLPKLLNSMKLGVERIRSISTSLRTFSRADKDHKVPFNLHEGIDSTILILRHRLKANDRRGEIEVVKNYGTMPPVQCFPGQLNQVFMNILANAIDALEDSDQKRSPAEIAANPSQITIRTGVSIDQQSAVIRIQDNGIGICEATQKKIFDHLFTTKEVGKGTGLGLAIAHQIVVEKHGGTLQVDSAPGQGAEFVIELPIQPE